MHNRAVFLDRDGTLVHARHYPSRPHDLLLYDGIGPALRRLQLGGFRLVMITNQSGIARGYFSEGDLARMHAYLDECLAAWDVRLDGTYYCPHHPEGTLPEFAIACDCRKPEPGMLLRAAADLHITMGESWFVGDILDDVQAGRRAGCRTILVDLGTESLPQHVERTPDYVARDTLHALEIIAATAHLGPAPDLSYTPPSWNRAAEQPALAEWERSA